MRSVLTLLTLSISMVACSNPFSSKKSSVLTENPKPKNESCIGVRFNENETNPNQFRAIIHCLNQNHELEAFDLWASSLSNEELKPLTNYLTSIIKNEPEFIYSLKELYVQINEEQEFQPLVKTLLQNLNNSESRKRLVKIIKSHSNWIQKFATEDQYKINFQNLINLTKVKSFQRLKIDNFQSANLNHLLELIFQYRNQKDSLNFKELFTFFSNARSELLSDKNKAQKVAGFINWLLIKNKLETFSRAAESLQNLSVSCFENELKLNKPLTKLLSKLGEINPIDSPSYFQKNIPSILILGKGYCKIEPVILSAAELLIEASNRDGFIDFFDFIQPLFKEESFQIILQSNSFRLLINQLEKLNDTHLFQDLITLRNWLVEKPVIQGDVPALLDSIFDEFNKNDFLFLVGLIPNDELVIRNFQKFIIKIPALRFSKLPSNQEWIAPFENPLFALVLEQTIQLNDENKINRFIDEIIVFFGRLIEKGKTAFKKNPVPGQELYPLPETSNWLLPFHSKTTVVFQELPQCEKISLRFDFFTLGSELNHADYLIELEKLSSCFGANKSFLSLKDLIETIIHSNRSSLLFTEINSLQREALSFLITNDYEESLKLFEALIKIDRNDLSNIKEVVEASSRLLMVSKAEFKSAKNLRQIAGDFLSKHETYRAINKQNDWNPPSFHDSSLELKISLNELVLKSISNIFNEHCKSLNSESSNCMIDSDQVELFLKSPSLLASEIVDEYLNSFQSWIHPKDIAHWKTNHQKPENVSTIEYHLNPLIHQIENQSNALEGLFSLIERNKVNGLDIENFLKVKSLNFSVIPYYFQNGNYPASRYEFKHTMRIRVLNDLDRLELLAINSDFKPFGWVKNFGMGFIRELATSWGDVPINKRPKFGTSETLSQARYSINKQYNRYNSQIIERFGNCKSLFSIHVCNAELSDIHARLFNLGYMLDLMDNSRNLVFFRDLFYSFYEKNTDQQRNIFIDGVKDQVICTDPTTRTEYCTADLLHMIPRITRLGLLHQTGLALAKSNILPTEAILKILNQSVAQNQGLIISKFLSSPSGIEFLRQLLTLVMKTNNNGFENLAAIVDSLSRFENMNWFNFGSQLMTANPELFTKYLPTLQISIDQLRFKSMAPEMIDLSTKLFNELNHKPVIDESLSILNSLSNSQADIQVLLRTRKPILPAKRWLQLLSDESKQRSRSRLSGFVTGKTFDDFCDVYSDTQTVNKAYNFLEASNQNSGVFELIEECRRFLH